MKICLVQGPFSPLFSYISKELTEHGHQVYRFSFCGGDEMLCASDTTSTIIKYDGLTCDWSLEFSKYCDEHEYDIVLGHGDCHFYNEAAFNACVNKGIEFFVTEEGYFRPDYVTLEKGGVNANSHMMDMDDYDDVSCLKPVKLEKLSASLIQRGYHCSKFYIANCLFRGSYRFYRHRREASATKEILSWVKTGCTHLNRKVSTHLKLNKLFATGVNFYLVPLQVLCDSQIVRHSKYPDVESFISEVMKSFASSASEDNMLVFKHHPYCLGFSDYSDVIQFLSEKHGLSERVIYLRGGHLPSLLKAASGVVTINSTVGLNALHHRVGCFVSGSAFYNKDGLTYQGALDDFWGSEFKPCEGKVTRLTSYIKKNVLVNASLYSCFYVSARSIVESLNLEL